MDEGGISTENWWDAETNPAKDDPCEKCKGHIGMMDVEGQYSGVCARCRGVIDSDGRLTEKGAKEMNE